MKDELQAAISAYWAARTPAAEQAAYGQMLYLGFPPAYGESSEEVAKLIAMTVPHAATLCDKCHGTGTVPHEKRKIDGGAPDPHDYQLVELCDKCGGAGALRGLPPRNLPETGIA